jgi:ribosomal protein S18 acetylase RimI-like enzyme
VKVRRARDPDIPAISALFAELDGLQHDWRVFTPRPGFYDGVAEKYRQALTTDDALVLVAEDEGEIVGMAYGEIQVPSRFSDERALDVSGVVVRAGHRGRGVGRALVAEAAGFAAENGVGHVTLNTFAQNASAMGFWEAMGFSARVVQLTAPSQELVARLTQA